MKIFNRSGMPHNNSEVTEKPVRIVTWFAIVLVLMAIATIAVMSRWALSSTDVVDIKTLPVPVRTIRQQPTTNGVVILHLEYCKKIPAEGRLRLSFVSSSREIFLPITTDRQPVGCEDRETPILIPKDIPPDKYKVKFRITYDINPLKKGIIEEFDSQEFEVAKP